ncbi:hypothetical protein PVK06_001285 [Gossypium arboreum]|uniref:Uncharacterized protein n=1 Tax=Gossypium arboreum TaxID=29729 RepID=A0ABR0R0R5_GOSAR|nr:hypothetical protein PVK06_001285 [Gossypium arboreum]
MGTTPSVGQIRIQRFRIGLNLSNRQGEMGGGHGESTTYKGLTLHHPKRWHVVTGKGLCAVMWFWVLYRAKQDGPVVLAQEDYLITGLLLQMLFQMSFVNFFGFNKVIVKEDWDLKDAKRLQAILFGVQLAEYLLRSCASVSVCPR